MTAVRLGIPLYVHPAVDPASWAALAGMAGGLEFVVVNVDSGPGSAVDVAYRRAVDHARAAGVPLVGYVHTSWALRGLPEVVADIDAWRRRYGITGLFIDEVATSPDEFGYYRVLTDRVRREDGGPLVLNPGCRADQWLCGLADLTCTFEGTAGDHPRASPVPGQATLHLVYDTPTSQVGDVVARARALGARSVYATDGALPNPWDHLPAHLSAQAALANPSSAGRHP